MGVASDIRSIFNSPDLLAANARLKELVASYFKSAPKLASWMEENLPQGFAVFALPPVHQIRLRTSNALKRVNREINRRTHVASIFPHELSLLRLVSAILCKTTDEWLIGKIKSTGNHLFCPKPN